MRKATRIFSTILSLFLLVAMTAMPVVAETPEERTNEVTLLNETFDDTLGWKGYLNPSRISWEVGGGCASVSDIGWSALQIVDAETLQGVSRFAVSVDIQFTTLKSNATTLMGLIYENDCSTSNININNGIVMLRSNNAGSLYLLNGGYSSGDARYLKTDGELSGGAGTQENFPQFGDYCDGEDIGNWFNLTLQIDRKAKTCTVLLDSKEVNTYTGFTVCNSGLFFLLQQNADTMVDNLKVSDASGVILYEEDFSEPDPLKLIQEAGTAPLKQSRTEGALRLENTNWCIYQLATLEQLQGASSYTISANLRLDTFASTNSQFSFRLNQAADAPKTNINSATVVSIYQTNAGIRLIGGNRDAAGWISSGDGAKTEIAASGVVTLGNWFHFSMTVDRVGKTCTVTLSNESETLTQTYEHIFDNDSNLSLVFQSQSSLVDDLKLTATYDQAVDLMGVQVTTQIGETYGLRFTSGIRMDQPEKFSSVGMKIVATYADGSQEFLGESATVWRSIRGQKDGVDCVLNAVDYGAASLFCVTIQEIPADLGSVTYTVTPFAKNLSGETVWFEAGSITVVNGVVSE